MNFKIGWQKSDFLFKNEIPLFFIAIYFVLSLINNLFLGANPKQSFLPILLLLLLFVITYFSSKEIPKSISEKKIILFVDFILLINVIFFITGKFNSEGHFLNVLREKAGFNVKVFFIIFSLIFFAVKIFYRKLFTLQWSFIFTALFFFTSLLLIPLLYPTPFIDLFIILKQSIVDISQNIDPYNRVFPDIYNGNYDYTYLKQDIKLVYWPFNLYLLYPFQVIFGDLRFAYIFSLVISCFILYLGTKKNKIVFYLSFILLFSNPYTFYMVKYAWIDILAFPFFALYFLLFKSKKYVIAFIILGILMALKLYYIFLLPISILYFYNITKKLSQTILIGILSIFISIICFLPFLFTNEQALIYTITYFLKSLPRFDSLSITGYFAQFGLNINLFSSFLSLLIIAIIFLRIWKNKRASILFQIQDLVLILFALFIFGKQAFGNYYFNLMFLAIIYISILLEKKEIVTKEIS
ncbi:hypothetical protein [Halpernia sp.]|uniref:hypothetical protein n=1 Tax=Halpernia sp. TaxID=2782209 RepID=UPI003A924266